MTKIGINIDARAAELWLKQYVANLRPGDEPDWAYIRGEVQDRLIIHRHGAEADASRRDAESSEHRHRNEG